MADLTFTAANLIPASGYGYRDMQAGATIAAGTPVYESSTTANTALVADNNDTAAKAAVVGLALHDAVSGQPVKVITGGDLAVGNILTVGTVYCLSASAGKVCPYADLASTNYVTIIGVATVATTLKVAIRVSGVAKP